MKTDERGLYGLYTSANPELLWITQVSGWYETAVYEFVCDYWTSTSSAHPSGVRFRNSYYSEKLTEALDFIMRNQDQFLRSADAVMVWF